ncbi:MAG: VIT1/CCC1 transporter family protein, partial [Acidimicrobiia bacterium]
RFTSTTIFGIDPHELGSPMTAALSSLVLFALGALLPLIPWFLAEGGAAALASVLVAAAASVAVGAVVGRSSGKGAIPGALRQLAIVAASSAVTYGIGVSFDTVTA